MNARKELIDIIGGNTIKCAIIFYDDYNYSSEKDWGEDFKLKVGYSIEEFNTFMKLLDFEYDSGYGIQHIYGTVWFMENGKWLERKEYDGKEWWDLKSCPEIQEDLK